MVQRSYLGATEVESEVAFKCRFQTYSDNDQGIAQSDRGKPDDVKEEWACHLHDPRFFEEEKNLHETETASVCEDLH